MDDRFHDARDHRFLLPQRAAFGLKLVGDTLLCGSGASQEQAIVEEALPCGPIAEYCGSELVVTTESTGKLVGNLFRA
jgi:hypothetical protein